MTSKANNEIDTSSWSNEKKNDYALFKELNEKLWTLSLDLGEIYFLLAKMALIPTDKMIFAIRALSLTDIDDLGDKIQTVTSISEDFFHTFEQTYDMNIRETIDYFKANAEKISKHIDEKAKQRRHERGVLIEKDATSKK